MKSQLDDLRKEQSIMDLEEGVSTDSTGSLTSESVMTITVGIVDEQRERDRRKFNSTMCQNLRNEVVQKERLMI